jgi:hypothetical protein
MLRLQQCTLIMNIWEADFYLNTNQDAAIYY